MSLYFWINIISVSLPFIVSFHPRIRLDKKWFALFPAIILAMIPYIVWDVYFTESGYWGFNPMYLQGVYILSLPIEEWLFFICIPYACVFTHVSMIELFKLKPFKPVVTRYITQFLFALFMILGLSFYDRAYTFVDATFAFVILLITWFKDRELLSYFYKTFLFMLIPFFIVNGILTGSFIEEQVVWYNDAENIGFRLGTIPVEDTIYAFSMLLLNLLLFRMIQRRIRGGQAHQSVQNT